MSHAALAMNIGISCHIVGLTTKLAGIVGTEPPFGYRVAIEQKFDDDPARLGIHCHLLASRTRLVSILSPPYDGELLPQRILPRVNVRRLKKEPGVE